MIQERLSLPVRDIRGLLSSVVKSRRKAGAYMSAYATAAGATLLEVDQ
jgi:hypothetical protein